MNIMQKRLKIQPLFAINYFIMFNAQIILSKELFFYALGVTLSAYDAVGNVYDLRTARVVIIVTAFGTVALNADLVVFVEIEIFCRFYVCLFLFKHAVFAFLFGFARAVFAYKNYACVTVAVAIMFAVARCAFKSRHTIPPDFIFNDSIVIYSLYYAK